MKRLLSAVLALMILLALPAAAWAEEASVELRTAEDLLRFSEACSQESYSAGRTFCLQADIDLSNTDFAPVPYFAGVFEGNGHAILGLKLTGEGSRQGLFRRVGKDAVIRDLTVRGSVTPGGTQSAVGGIVGENAGLLETCSFEGTVAGIEDVGGIAGRNLSGSMVENCSFSGDVTGEHQVGGIVGKNEGIVNRCTNAGRVNTVPVTPHGEKRFDISALSEDDFLNLSNIGGIAGSNTSVLLECVNNGEVGYKLNGYNVGGVAGRNEGLVRSCMNNAAVTGRRDVGGIVGQLIPWSRWDLSEGKLDELSGQIGALQGQIAQLSADAQYLSGEVQTEITALHGYSNDAVFALRRLMEETVNSNYDVIDSIQFDPETGIDYSSLDVSIPDSSELTFALMNMQGEAAALADIAGTGVSLAAEDLSGIAGQLSGVMAAVDAIMQSLGGSVLDEIYDLSATETYEHDEGAVEGCGNFAAVSAENNAGGIVGTSAFEVEFDMENRLNASRFLLSNAKQYLFAAVRDCRGVGAVSVKSDGAGLIAGTMDIGAVVNCIGLGEASSSGGDYVGGIAGQTAGTIRACWTRAQLSGGKYIGGLAGLGTDISDSRSWAHITGGTEYLGAVAGWADGSVSGNLYVPEAPAGVDGAALIGQSTPVEASALLSGQDVPGGFDLLTVSFVADGEMVAQMQVPFGGSLRDLPEVPNRGEAYWKWDDFDAEHIYFSREVTGRYYEPNSALSTGEEVPRFLAEGTFYEGQRLHVADYAGVVEDETLGAWTVWVDGQEGPLKVRMYAPDPDSAARRIGEGGRLENLDAARDGSYLVFTLENGGSVALVREIRESSVQRYAVGAIVFGVLLLLGLGLVVHRSESPKEEGKASETERPKEKEQAALSV